MKLNYLYKEIHLSNGVGCDYVIKDGVNMILNASDGIKLHEGFEVELGSEFKGSTEPCLK